MVNFFCKLTYTKISENPKFYNLWGQNIQFNHEKIMPKPLWQSNVDIPESNFIIKNYLNFRNILFIVFISDQFNIKFFKTK